MTTIVVTTIVVIVIIVTTITIFIMFRSSTNIIAVGSIVSLIPRWLSVRYRIGNHD